jgi:hypothetical protein
MSSAMRNVPHPLTRQPRPSIAFDVNKRLTPTSWGSSAATGGRRCARRHRLCGVLSAGLSAGRTAELIFSESRRSGPPARRARRPAAPGGSRMEPSTLRHAVGLTHNARVECLTFVSSDAFTTEAAPATAMAFARTLTNRPPCGRQLCPAIRRQRVTPPPPKCQNCHEHEEKQYRHSEPHEPRRVHTQRVGPRQYRGSAPDPGPPSEIGRGRLPGGLSSPVHRDGCPRTPGRDEPARPRRSPPADEYGSGAPRSNGPSTGQ